MEVFLSQSTPPVGLIGTEFGYTGTSSLCARNDIYYRNKYREGGDCLDIKDRGWVV